MLPYGKQSISDEDIAAVTAVLRSDWLTTGPAVAKFEKKFAEFAGAKEAVAVSSGTAALHAAMHAIGVNRGSEVIVPAMTFAATANSVVYCQGKPVFIDVEPGTLLIDHKNLENLISKRTKAIVAVDYAGQPCDYEELRDIAGRHSLPLIGDACHALGGRYHGQAVGSLADLNIFSLHPVKHITSGEGGVITTDDSRLAERMRIFRNHGISTDHFRREQMKTWYYEMIDLGYNYRLTDFQCALASSQLTNLSAWVQRRQVIARAYCRAFDKTNGVMPLELKPDISHAYHIFVARFCAGAADADRDLLFRAFRAEGIGVNVHYFPVHLHPFYRRHFKTREGQCPVAEAASREILTLPLFPRMSDLDIQDVINAVQKIMREFS